MSFGKFSNFIIIQMKNSDHALIDTGPKMIIVKKCITHKLNQMELFGILSIQFLYLIKMKFNLIY